MHVEKRNSLNVYIKYITYFLFYIFTFLEVVNLSSFPAFFDILKPKSTLLVLMIIVLMILEILNFKKMRQLIFWLVIILLIVVNFYFIKQFKSTIIYQLIFLLIIPASEIEFEKIVKVHMYAILSATFFVVLLSLMDYLPKSGSQSTVLFSAYQNTVYSYGFNHPNGLGFLIIISGIEYTFLHKERFSLSVIIIDIVAIILAFLLGADTSVFGGVIVLFGYILSLNKAVVIIKKTNKIVMIIPITLVLFSFWVTHQPGTLIYQTVNKIVSSRPDLWSYYLQNFKISMFGSNVALNLNAGPTSTFGNGILDGSYIYQPLYFGWFGLFLFLISLYSLYLMRKTTNFKLYIYLFVAFSLMAFPENEISLFSINTFLVVLGYYQFNVTKRMKLFSIGEEKL